MEMTTNLPGIVGLFAYSPTSAKPLKLLAEEVLRNPSFSRIEVGKRELIATMVSHWNECMFCQQSHKAVAYQLLGEDYVTKVFNGKPDRHMAQMLMVAADVTKSTVSSAWIKQILKPIVQAPPVEGEEITALSEREEHDITLIASMFNMYNRYVSGMRVANPDLSWDDYMTMAKHIIETGYEKSEP